MKKRARKLYFRISKPIFNKLGYQRKTLSFHQILDGKNLLLQTLFTNIKSMGFFPNHIVDIGANHGTWTREVLTYFPDAQYTLLEPQERLKASLQDLLDSNSKITFHPVGAGSENGSFKFTIVDRDDSCSFRYSEKEAIENGFEQYDVQVVTLNELIKSNGLPIPDIIKIDAEGLDIEVLKGANDFFGKTEMFMVEAGIVNKSFDNSFLKLINYMDENGYRLFEITDLNRPFELNVLWLVELAFVKKNGIIDSYQISF
ncbi:FkbM family methyltransferase [Flavobacterium capsici]|uniref:FkbM family methyltransferase n=1 Tax=Flavobacterium capsici TaxID=3075618 RepID=A0AA96F0B2_9FLAO|nr:MULTISPECIES: FkbM family methyltransferase [unclassified Flavobacterium]WNM20245.1 FkbM family methyltransferase [Flavobacterium sp. PMR2A8]WNM21635.1 FkbM family methyltransferase [Flavobacterium sp. PMTSA4]